MRSDAHDEHPSKSLLSPLRAFLALLVLLIAAGVLLLATRSNDDPAPAELDPTITDFSLTDAEAIERFKELNALAWQSARDRDLSLLPRVFTEDGPTGERAARAIRELLRDDVIDQSTSETLNIEVLVNHPSEIQLRETSRLDACFLNENGRDVTDAPAVVQRKILWTLRKEDTVWQIHDGILENQRPIESDRATCD
jgi:hypothetical protein